jgi:hypothetical protein
MNEVLELWMANRGMGIEFVTGKNISTRPTQHPFQWTPELLSAMDEAPRT